MTRRVHVSRYNHIRVTKMDPLSSTVCMYVAGETLLFFYYRSRLTPVLVGSAPSEAENRGIRVFYGYRRFTTKLRVYYGYRRFTTKKAKLAYYRSRMTPELEGRAPSKSHFTLTSSYDDNKKENSILYR